MALNEKQSFAKQHANKTSDMTCYVDETVREKWLTAVLTGSSERLLDSFSLSKISIRVLVKLDVPQRTKPLADTFSVHGL